MFLHKLKRIKNLGLMYLKFLHSKPELAAISEYVFTHNVILFLHLTIHRPQDPDYSPEYTILTLTYRLTYQNTRLPLINLL